MIPFCLRKRSSVLSYGASNARSFARSGMVNDVDVQSCHSAGKTKVAAVATLGWVARPGGLVLTTAPTWDQGPGYVVRQI